MRIARDKNQFSPLGVDRAARRRAAFTLVEMLVVIVVVALLLSILLAAFSNALSASKRAATEQFLRAVQQGAEQFRQDFGYYPPLIDPAKHTIESRFDEEGESAFREELLNNRYHSVFSPTVYLIGVGELAPSDPQDDANPPDFVTNPNNPNYPDRHDGQQGPGIRNPGPDQSWGGAVERDRHNPDLSGPTFGPYIDVASGQNIRRVKQDDLLETQIEEADESGLFDFGDDDEEGGLFVLVDRWDRPIRYYRHWPTRDPNPGDQQDDPGGPSNPGPFPTPMPGQGGDGSLAYTLEFVPVELRLAGGSQQDLIRSAGRFGLLSAGPNAQFGDIFEVTPGEESLVAIPTPDGGQSQGGTVFSELTREQQSQITSRAEDNVRVLP